MHCITFENGQYVLYSKLHSPYRCKTEEFAKDEQRELILQHVKYLRH